MAIVTILMSGGCRAIRRIKGDQRAISARRLSGAGFAAMHDGDWEHAESLFAEALDVSGTDDRATWGLAEACWNRGQCEEAIRHLEHAVELSAGDPAMVRRLGRWYLESGRFDLADRHSRWALAQGRGDSANWTLRGDYLSAVERPEEALAAYHQALAIYPDDLSAKIATAEIYQRQRRYGRMLAAVESIRDSVGSDAAPGRVDRLRGLAMRNMGRPDEAERSFRTAVRKDVGDHLAMLELAELSLESGQPDLAADWSRRARAAGGDSVGDVADRLDRRIAAAAAMRR